MVLFLSISPGLPLPPGRTPRPSPYLPLLFTRCYQILVIMPPRHQLARPPMPSHSLGLAHITLGQASASWSQRRSLPQPCGLPSHTDCVAAGRSSRSTLARARERGDIRGIRSIRVVLLLQLLVLEYSRVAVAGAMPPGSCSLGEALVYYSSRSPLELLFLQNLQPAGSTEIQ